MNGKRKPLALITGGAGPVRRLVEGGCRDAVRPACQQRNAPSFLAEVRPFHEVW